MRKSANWGVEFLPADFTKSAVADLRISANWGGSLPADFSKSAVADLRKSANWGGFLPADFRKCAVADLRNLHTGDIPAYRFQ